MISRDVQMTRNPCRHSLCDMLSRVAAPKNNNGTRIAQLISAFVGFTGALGACGVKGEVDGASSDLRTVMVPRSLVDTDRRPLAHTSGESSAPAFTRLPQRITVVVLNIALVHASFQVELRPTGIARSTLPLRTSTSILGSGMRAADPRRRAAPSNPSEELKSLRCTSQHPLLWPRSTIGPVTIRR